MTFETLKKIIEKHNIPQNVELIDDCGWECSENPIKSAFYSRSRNEIVFIGDATTEYSGYLNAEVDDWKCIYAEGVYTYNTFRLEDYRGRYVMHCDTKEKAKTFCKNAMKNSFISWWDLYGKDTVYYFNEFLYGGLKDVPKDYNVLEFDDFDWGDNNELC